MIDILTLFTERFMFFKTYLINNIKIDINIQSYAAANILDHNFLPFGIQHTKSPQNQIKTYALGHMSKVLQFLSLTTSRPTAAGH